jgi:hypothetical protein
MKFRKKPIVIEAVQIGDEMMRSAPDWLLEAVNNNVIILFGLGCSTPVAHIETLEGSMLGNTGDWIIRGVKGEFYPCKPDIFDATYEMLEEWNGN